MPFLRTTSCTLAVALASACARSGEASSTFSDGPQPGIGDETSSGSGSSGTSGTTTSTGSAGGSVSGDNSSTSMPAASTGILDIGTQPDFDLPPVGCQGKIDFLFVIESWYSMKEVQDRLQVAFKSFTTMLGNEFADFDYHIMVVDTCCPLMPNTCDACYDCTGCMGPGCTQYGGPADYPCKGPFEECDTVDGAGVTITGNFNATNHRCELLGGNRYIIKGEPNLEEQFKCIATLGEGPKGPVAAENLMAALQPKMLDGGCNDGFVRNDALLAVIELTGTSDDLSPGTPQSWYDTLVAAKRGNEEAVVLLTFSHDLDEPEPKCSADNWARAPQRDFAEAAAHGLWESICVDSYIPALTKMADMILEQCAVFVPQ